MDGVAITEEDMAKAAGPKWAQFKAQEYAFKRELIEGAIGQKLLENEAKKRGITVADLRQQEVESKTEVVSETQAKEFYEQNRQRFGTLSEAEALDQIQKGLFQQRLQRKLNEYVATLKSGASVRVLLEPHRIKVDPSDDPSKGPADAAVTIVEFSDFQCPYCSRIPPVLKRVEETYGKNVRVVFRDFPLLSIHPNAAKAAEAGACAADQNKFWEMHDEIFANQQKLAVDDLKAHAKKVGLDSAAFDACLDSGKKAEEWKADTADGEKLRRLGHAVRVHQRPPAPGRRRRFEQMTPIIDEELQLKGLPVPPKAPAAPAPVAQRRPLHRGSSGSEGLAGQVERPRRQLAVIEAGGAVEQRQPRRQGRGEAPLVDAAAGARERVGPARPPRRHARARSARRPARDAPAPARGQQPREQEASRASSASSFTVNAATTAPRRPGSVAPRERRRAARGPRTPSRAERPARLLDRPAAAVDALHGGAAARLQRPGGAGRRPSRTRGPAMRPRRADAPRPARARSRGRAGSAAGRRRARRRRACPRRRAPRPPRAARGAARTATTAPAARGGPRRRSASRGGAPPAPPPRPGTDRPCRRRVRCSSENGVKSVSRSK